MLGHTGTIRCIKFSKDGASEFQRLLSVGSGDFIPRVWELTKGTCTLLDCHSATVHACVWLSGNIVATGCEHGLILIHDIRLNPSTILQTHLPDNLEIFSMIFAPFTNKHAGCIAGLLICGCTGGVCALFLLSDTGNKFNLDILLVRKTQDQDIRSMDIISRQLNARVEEFLFLTTSFDQRSLVWNIKLDISQPKRIVKLELVSTLIGHTDKVLCGLLTTEGRGGALDVITSGADGRLLCWSL